MSYFLIFIHLSMFDFFKKIRNLAIWHSTLSNEQNKELSKRGFFVKEYFSFKFLLKTLTIAFIGVSTSVANIKHLWPEVIKNLLTSFTQWDILITAYMLFIALILLSTIVLVWVFLYKIFVSYVFSWKFFYTQESIYAYSRTYYSVWDIKWLWVLLIFNRPNPKIHNPFIEDLLYCMLVGIMFIVLSLAGLLIIYLYLVWILVLALLLRQLVEHFHPLYAFGNLWSKIQSLTPRITEESEKIEKEFSTDMNFRTLSDSFDTLSTDFSQISSYVIKLETIEQKANKWNLFDSEKYIGSLREDIVKPLISLRSFLEKKKTELEKSKEEIRNLWALDGETSSAWQKVRVRVWVGWSWNTWWNWETENLELSSKRSEPLIQELTENIEKLDIMIVKFGKI